MKIAVVGATGLVGSKMLQVLEERNFPVTELIPVASASSVGKKVTFKGKEYTIVSAEQAIAMKPVIAIFSAGGGTSLELAPKFAAAGIIVIDNSSAWRMDPTKKLVIPEINAHELTRDDLIIANPNCSTIQMLVAIAPLHKKYGIARLVISTYQSVTGTGVKAVRQLEDEERQAMEIVETFKNVSDSAETFLNVSTATHPETTIDRAYPHQIYRNCIPQCDVFTDNGYTKEEMKMINETRKILGDNSIMVTATTVRVPVTGGHSEAVNIEFRNEYELADIRKILSDTPGLVVVDNPAKSEYPMALTANGRDEVFVGRIRRDESREKCLNLWVVSDNLRKGAATNAIQIAEYLVANKLVS
jgi:aspartate-semialdehyde dehydrogenase